MNGTVILNDARELLADEIFGYREPIPAPLNISPWVAMSLLDARLMPAKYVRPCSRGQKNDFNDAEAIAERSKKRTSGGVLASVAALEVRVPNIY